MGNSGRAGKLKAKPERRSKKRVGDDDEDYEESVRFGCENYCKLQCHLHNSLGLWGLHENLHVAIGTTVPRCRVWDLAAAANPTSFLCLFVLRRHLAHCLRG